MALLDNPNATVKASQGFGPKTVVYSVATGTITMEDATKEITTTYFGTIAGVEGIVDGNHVAVQGGTFGCEATAGITLVASFDNPF